MEPFMREAIAFLVSNLGKASIGLLSATVSFCFPWLPGYAVAAMCAYYAMHQLRPIAIWVYCDILADLEDEFTLDAEPEEAPQ